MARSARLEELGLPLHVIAQGIERCALFRDRTDRLRMLTRMLRVFREMGVEVLAWCFMDNHLHLVVRTTKGGIGKAMQRVLGPYAQGFNARHGRVGRLFRDRFWSRPVEDDDDVLNLIAYVLLNPLAGGLVRNIDELLTYPWSAMREIVLPRGDSNDLVDRVGLLTLFGATERHAIRDLIDFLGRKALEICPDADASLADLARLDVLAERSRRDLEMRSNLSLQLRSDRIDEVLRERASIRAIRMRLKRDGWTLDGVVRRASRIEGVRPSRVRAGRRGKCSRARELVVHYGSNFLGCSGAEIARATGVSHQAVSSMRSRRGRRSARLPNWQEFFGPPPPRSV